MRRRFVRSKWLLGLSLFLLLGSAVLGLPTQPPQAQAQLPKFLIENFETKQCLDTGNQTRGNPYQFECNPNNPAQQWVFPDTSAGGANFTIRNVGSGACLDHANRTELGFQVYLFDCYNGLGQAFTAEGIKPPGVDPGNPGNLLGQLIAVSSGLVLDGFGTNPYLFTDQNSNRYQLWILRPVE